MDCVQKEAVTFIAGCYGKCGSSMSDVCYQAWLTKVRTKSVRKMLTFQNLPPTTDAYAENVKLAHIQECIWKSVLGPDHAALNPTMCGWIKDATT